MPSRKCTKEVLVHPPSLKSVRRQLGVAHRLLDVSVSQVGLQPAGVTFLAGEGPVLRKAEQYAITTTT